MICGQLSGADRAPYGIRCFTEQSADKRPVLTREIAHPLRRPILSFHRLSALFLVSWQKGQCFTTTCSPATLNSMPLLLKKDVTSVGRSSTCFETNVLFSRYVSPKGTFEIFLARLVMREYCILRDPHVHLSKLGIMFNPEYTLPGQMVDKPSV